MIVRRVPMEVWVLVLRIVGTVIRVSSLECSSSSIGNDPVPLELKGILLLPSRVLQRRVRQYQQCRRVEKIRGKKVRPLKRRVQSSLWNRWVSSAHFIRIRGSSPSARPLQTFKWELAIFREPCWFSLFGSHDDIPYNIWVYESSLIVSLKVPTAHSTFPVVDIAFRGCCAFIS